MRRDGADLWKGSRLRLDYPKKKGLKDVSVVPCSGAELDPVGKERY